MKVYKPYLISVLVCFTWSGCTLSTSENPPNIIIIMADDMGYIDAECYGGPIKTPNINLLANEGMRFTDFYSAAPNCSPARTGLLTGRTPSRVGVYDYLASNSPMHLPKSEITIAEMLKETGYETCHVGKWHLSTWTKDGMIGPKPDEQGFDYWFAVDNNAVPSHLNPINFERNGEKVGPMEGYSCQLVIDEAISWLENNHNEEVPFFLNVWFNEPHAKIASPPELIKEYEQYGKDAEYMANVANMDLAIGKLIKYLDKNGLSEHSFIVFASDNGPYRQASTGNFRGKKSFLYEGGIRVPGIIKWPGKIDRGIETNTPASFVDLLPTIAEITGSEMPGDRVLDGTSILPVLLEEPFERARPLYWFFYKRYPISALRKGDYMIMGNPGERYILNSHPFDSIDQVYFKNAKLEEFQVYNLRNDPEQKNNLYPTDSVMFRNLKKEIIKYHKEIIEEGPNWSSLPRE
jgi:arylsulfatase A